MAQVVNLLKLRIIVTLRGFSKSTTSIIESMFFIPMFLLAMLIMFQHLPHVLQLTRNFNIPPVMLLNYFFLSLAILWVSIPFMGFRLNESLEIKRLQHFPVKFPVMFFALFIGNFLDLSTLVPVTFLGALLKYMYLENSNLDLTGAVLICLVVFVFLQLIYQTIILMLYNLLPGVNPFKIVAGLLVLIVFGMILLLNGVITIPKDIVMFSDENLAFHNRLPTGTFAISAYEFFLGNSDLGYKFLLKSVLWLLPLLVFNMGVTYLTYRGIEISYTRKIPHHNGLRRSFFPKLEYTSWSHPSWAILLKDFQTNFRDWHYIFYKMMPGVFTPTMIMLILKYNLQFVLADVNDYFVIKVVRITFIVLVFMIFLSQSYIFVGNIFGYERAAISNIFMAPVSDFDIFLGKNLFLICLLTFDSIVISILTKLIVGNNLIPIGCFAFLECMILVLIGLGNLCSMIFPFYVPMDKPSVSFQGTLIVGLMNMAANIALFIILSPVIYFILSSIKINNALYLSLSILFSLLYSLVVYILLLRYASRLLPHYRESIYHNVSSL